MGRHRDQFWDHAEKLNDRFKCNYCEQDFPGGASRIKAHLAGIPGHDIKACNAVPQDVQEKAQATQKIRETQVTQGTNKKLKSVSSSASKSKTKIVSQKEAYEATQGTNKKLKNASISSSDKESTITSTSILTIQKEKIVTQSEEEYITSTSISTIQKEKIVTQSEEEYITEIVGRLVTKAFSLATKDIIFKWAFKEELENLFDTLYTIKVVLLQKRQVSEIWLMELRNVAYEVDNVLDEFDYEIIRQKVQLQSQMIDHNKVKTIKQSLDKLVNDVVGFGLRTELLKSIIKIRLDKNEDPFLKNSNVIGREFEVIEIVNELISSSNEQVISVLPIVGMPGLGKTTLAKVLYSHKEIKKHFDVLAWVHVNGNFDVEEISKKIRKSLKIDFTNLERKKYFLVLDDIWIEDHDIWIEDHDFCEILRSHLVGINSNTRINIIVTMCSDKVAQIMGTLPPHHLEKLSQADCWSIFKKIKGKSLAFALESRGREIAKKCRGVPLVARVLGEAMYSKWDKNEWLAIQNDKIWCLFDDDNSGIFPALQLCFDNLPIPSLKQCFAFCAIFPKDYDMKKDEIIQYWMAEGFLEPAKEPNMTMEDIGNMYFNILLATSFFQNARKDAYGNIISCKMHDLVHDFALSISKPKTLILERDSMDDISNVQCLFVRSDGKATPGSSFSGEGFIKLRTLILENFDFKMLSNFKYLRVLKLFGDSIRGFPDSIEQLIHLRLLRISYVEIEELPKSITKLYNLQTLIIEGYRGELLEDLSNLIKLRHILLNSICDYNDSIMPTPKKLGRLTCLQTLQHFVVDLDEGYQIKELGDLKNLRGELHIWNLENVEDKEEAKSAKLKEKEIFKLGLYWDEDSYDSDAEEEKVLEGLQPHPNLKSLTIEFYGGKKFPSWVGLSSLYHNLIEINLRSCRNCEEVPTLGQLPCLRVLEIYKMEKVRSLGSEFYSYSDGSYRITTTLFPALRILKLEYMSNLVEWKDAKELTSAGEVLVFPCLEELTIIWCLNLRDLPDSLHTRVSLQKLVVQDCPKLRSLPGVRSIIRCGIEDPPSGLQRIEYLENGDCRLPSSSSSSTSSIHSSLQKLKLIRCGSLLLDQIQFFIALKILWIGGSHEMVALPEGLGNLSSLQELYIVNCCNLVHLPTKETMGRLTQLKTLIIFNCPKFKDNERINASQNPPRCLDFED